jgi:hypothetical protein
MADSIHLHNLGISDSAITFGNKQIAASKGIVDRYLPRLSKEDKVPNNTTGTNPS